MLDTPSLLALALTLLLALLSAMAFVLVYLRSPWAPSAPAARGNNKSHLHSHSHLPHGGCSTGHSHANSTNHAHSHASPQPVQLGTAHSHSHAHTHSPTKHAHASNSSTSDASHSHSGAGLNSLVGTGLSSLSSQLGGGAAGSLAFNSSSSGSVVSATPGASSGSLTAADIALRGRKAKKRGGRVHVMLGAGGAGGPNSTSPAAAGGGRGRGASLASPSPYVYPLDFLSVAPPVIVCVSTLPSRVHHIDKALNSIKTQNYPISQMLLVIPEESRREHTKYSIPDRVRKDAIMTVVRVSHDYGPATALISAWSALPSSEDASPASLHRDTMIIRLDDDMVYHPDTVATLVRHALAHPDSAVGFAGYSLRGPPFVQPNFAYAKRREERVDINWRQTQAVLQQQINYAAANAPPSSSVAMAAAAAAAAAAAGGSSNPHTPAHLLSHVVSPSLDPSLLPAFDPLPSAPFESDPYAAPLPNPNDVYDTESVDVLTAWRGGVLLRKRFLDERMWREYAEMPEAAMQADDEWISGQLCRNGVGRRVILAPFDMILGRLRLRHGRHSASASHLAYQQTLLETLVEKGMLTCSAAHAHSDTTGRAQQRSSSNESSDSKDADTDAPTSAESQAQRLQQLIRTISLDDDGPHTAEG